MGETFMQLAKEMLADPVYQRVMVAAIHRMREQTEEAPIKSQNGIK